MPVVLSVKSPVGVMRVAPALATPLPLAMMRPAGLYTMAEPSWQGEATPVPPRPMVHEPCSLTL